MFYISSVRVGAHRTTRLFVCLAVLAVALPVAAVIGASAAPGQSADPDQPAWHAFAQTAQMRLNLTAVGSIGDTPSLELNGAWGIEIFHIDGRTYAIVAGHLDDGVQILDITDPSDIMPTYQIDDNHSLALQHTHGVATFQIDGRTYVAVTSTKDAGVQILDLTDPYNVTATDKITDTNSLALQNSRGVDTFKINGSTYVAITGQNDSGVQILNVTDPYNITAAGQIFDNGSLVLSNARDIAIFQVDNRTYAIVVAMYGHGAQILDLTDPYNITAAGQIRNDDNIKLHRTMDVDIFQMDNHTYAAVASLRDDGVQILNVTDPYNITAAGYIVDTRLLELDAPYALDTFQIYGHTYVAVAAHDDHGVQVLNVTDPHHITAAGYMRDDYTLKLAGAHDIEIFQTGGHTYIAVTSYWDNGLQIIRLGEPIEASEKLEYQLYFDPRELDRIILSSTTPGTILATWTAPTDIPASYRVSWAKVGESFLTKTDRTGNAFPIEPYRMITGLEEGETYNVKVRARYWDSGGIGGWSNTFNVTVAGSPSNYPPVVDAGPGQTVLGEVAVILNGTASDPDPGDRLTYLWTHNSASSDITLANATSASTTFTAPRVDSDTAITFTLTADDGTATSSDSVIITVTAPVNNPPSVEAGSAQTVQEGSEVSLNGTASDPDPGDRLTYLWSHNSTLDIALDNQTALSATFTAPQVDSDSAIAFTLTAGDPHSATASDIVTVTILDIPDESIIPLPFNNTVVLEPPEPRGSYDIGRVTLNGTTPGTVQITWGEPDEEPANYRVSWARVGENYLTWTDSTGNAFPTAPSHTVTDLEEGVQYKVRVRASYDGTAGNWSGDAVITVAGAAANTPAAGLPVIGGTAQVGHTLTANTFGITDADGMTNSTLSYQWISNDGTATDTEIANATASTYVLTAGDLDSTIKVTVTFTDDAGHVESLTSAATQTVASTSTVPGSPTSLGVLPNGSGTLDVSWQPPASNGGSNLTGYTVQWKAASGTWTVPADVTEVAVTGTTHTITGLTDGTSYTVRVIATNDVGDGAPSAEETATPQAPTPPRGPREIGGIVLNSTILGVIDVSWDAPNETPANYRVMWAKVGESYLTWTDLTGNAFPTVPSHTITGLEDDRQYQIKVRASYDGTAGDWSDEVTATTMAAGTVIIPNRPATGLPAITGTAEVGQTLAADVSGIADADGMTNATLSYQWISGDGTDDTEIAGATASTYVLTAGDLGSTIKVTITFTDDADHQESLTSAATQTVVPVPNRPATGLPAITGTAEVGQTLAADVSGIADADGMTNATLSYQWISGDGTDDTEIAGATASTYVLTAGDLGSTIKVTITFTDDADHQESLTSAATQTVVPVPNRPATGLPAITGTAEVGQTLVTDVSGIADADGMTNATLSYQWISGDGTDDTEIAGATASTYVLTAGDLGSTIKVTITFTDDADHQESLTSAATQTVVPVPNRPATGLPAITGTAEVGQTLAADVSGIADADGMTNATLSYQWISGDGTDDTEIAGATASTYVLTAGDLGSTIKVTITFTDDADHQESLTSAATQTVVPVPNRPATGLPAITGTAEVGQTLVTDVSGIADADGMTNATLSYQWISGDGTDDTEIAGATASTYVLTAGDLGSTIKVTITFTDDADHQESLTSAATQTVVPVPNRPATGLPAITGTAEVGQTLAADVSGIADADGMTNSTLSYQWISGDGTDDTEIAGATASTYVLTAGDLGSTIKVTITFTDDADHQESVTSAPTQTVASAPVTTVVETSSQFITTWQTTIAGESITIPVGGATGIYTIDWGDGNTDHDVSGDQRHTYDDAGTYTVRISGDFTRIYLNGEQPNAGKLQSIEQWGDVRWESMGSAFQGASSMVYRADDAPDLSDVASMRYMFEDAAFFDGDLSDWDVSSVTDMTRMFDHASRFSGDLSTWNVSGVTTMDYMFHDAFAFNGNISTWDVSGVTDMRAMFRNAFYFNSDLSMWDVSGVTDMRAMFRGAVEFNDNISAWNVSSVTKMRNMFSGADAFDQNLGKWYIVLDDTVIEDGNTDDGAIGRITAQNLFLDRQDPTYRIGSGADSEHFEIDGTALKLKKTAQNNLASGSYTITITSTGEFGTGNSRTYEIVVAYT